MIGIVYKNADFVVVNKPIGIPSQADNNGGDDAMKQTAEALAALGEKGTLHIINRLDTVVSGLVLFARNPASAAALTELLSGGITKEYRAVCEGVPGDGVMKDFLVKEAALGRAIVASPTKKGAKEAELHHFTLETVEYKGKKLSLVRVILKTGRFHQIRAQFSSRKMPLVGDKKYGSRDFLARTPALFAARLAFDFKGEKYDFKISPDTSAYPWCLFNEENFSR